MENVQPQWTLPELAAQVAVELSNVDVEQHSGRVRDVPDARTIRYYTTLGLLDRPGHVKGRTAYYSRRHLMQLVAIKRMQARGIPLSEIQEKLYGVTPSQLARLAGMEPVKDAPRKSERAGFWKARPTAVSVEKPPEEPLAQQVHGVRLHDAVTLLLSPPGRALHPDDVEAIEAAAAPLMKLLHARRLIADEKP